MFKKGKEALRFRRLPVAGSQTKGSWRYQGVDVAYGMPDNASRLGAAAELSEAECFCPDLGVGD
jgi:hypothetical protein